MCDGRQLGWLSSSNAEWPSNCRTNRSQHYLETSLASTPNYERSSEEMISKYLAIAAAIAFLTAGTAGQVFAQQNANPPTAAAPAAAPQPGGGNAAAPNNAAPAPNAAAPATPDNAAPSAPSSPPPAVNPPATGASAVGGNSPYGL